MLKNDILESTVLGSDGWFVFGGSPAPGSSQPSYVSSVTLTSSVFPGNSSYARIDNPLTTPGASPTQETYSGAASLNVGPNMPAVIATFSLGGNIPSRIQVGVLIGGKRNGRRDILLHGGCIGEYAPGDRAVGIVHAGEEAI